MGVRNNTETRKSFYSIMGGKVVRSYGKQKPEGVENLTQRINKNGDTVYEVNFDEIYGTITGVEIKEHEDYGKFLVLSLNDGEETSQIQTSIKSNYARTFMLKAPNIDPNNPVVIKPYSFEDKETGKQRTGLSIFYSHDPTEAKIPHFWTKENPGKLPQPEQKEFDGEMKWDFGKQNLYLQKYLTEKFIPKLPSLDSIEPSKSFEDQVTEATQSADNEDDELSDLPF